MFFAFSPVPSAQLRSIQHPTFNAVGQFGEDLGRIMAIGADRSGRGYTPGFWQGVAGLSVWHTSRRVRDDASVGARAR